MNSNDSKYSKYALVREMLETSRIIKNFNFDAVEPYAAKAASKKAFFFTGEGSSRIFPAKRAISWAFKNHFFEKPLHTDSSLQAKEYKLDDHAVFTASNSGQTREVISLVLHLIENGHKDIFGLTANKNTKLEELVQDTFILSCGKEEAVAATKSVVEQGLFYDALLRKISGKPMEGLDALSEQTATAMTAPVDPAVTEMIKNAGMIYFAGRNNGVAEELALKTNEITRKKSAFLEGTFALHGIEEVMNPDEVVIWVDPYKEEEDNFIKRLVKGVGMNVITISSEKTPFPGIIIPDGGQYAEYVQLTAGWNLLVETGIALGIDLDKPKRARKVGNEFIAK